MRNRLDELGEEFELFNSLGGIRFQGLSRDMLDDGQLWGWGCLKFGLDTQVPLLDLPM